jgi:uncharacterized metal-binding protein YceD (DUF177 family)
LGQEVPTMPELISRAPGNPDFARVLELRQLRDLESFDFDIAPTEAEAAALARLLGANAVRKLRFAGRLEPAGRGGWRLDGRLGATVVQPCVVTLEPVTTRIDQPVRRTWLPDAGRSPLAEVVVDVDADDEPEPLGERIDLGLVATEALALAMPAYPRKPGAALSSPAEEAEDERARPFAALAPLRGKLGEER